MTWFSQKTPNGRPKGTLALGGGLAQLSASLAAMPASRTHLVPSTEATTLLRSVGYHDKTPLVLSSLYRQPGSEPIAAAVPASTAVASLKSTASKVAHEVDEPLPLEYEQMTSLVAERLDRLARLTTDNFLREQAELDWEQERASLVSVELDALHLHGREEVSCNPIAGFTQAPLRIGNPVETGGHSNKCPSWDQRDRLYHAVVIVQEINEDKWKVSTERSKGSLQPLYDLSYRTQDDREKKLADTTLSDCLEENRSQRERCALGAQERFSPASGAQDWQYLAELYRILHSIALQSARPAPGCELERARREEALLEGSLNYLRENFVGMLKLIYKKNEGTQSSDQKKIDDCNQMTPKKKLESVFNQASPGPSLPVANVDAGSSSNLSRYEALSS